MTVPVFTRLAPVLFRGVAGLPHRMVERGDDRLLFVGGEILRVELLPGSVEAIELGAASRKRNNPFSRSPCGRKASTCFSNCPQAPPEMIATSTIPSNRARSAAISASRSDLLSARVPSRSNMIRLFMRVPGQQFPIAAWGDLSARTRPSKGPICGKQAASQDR